MFALNHILCVTSFLGFFLFPYIQDPILKYSSLVLFTISQAFWFTPKRQTLIYYLDIFMARSFCMYGFYLMVSQNKFVIVPSSIMVMFYLSSYVSSYQKWCSWKHIFFHSLFHLSGFWIILSSKI
jgi:hypothetical protein